MDSSVPKEGLVDSYNHSGSGDMFNAPGGNATKNVYNGSTNVYHVPVATPDQLRCHDSLYFLEMDRRSNDIEDAAGGTCKWLSDHEAYVRWASSDRALLWIRGKPGSGKSTLLQHVLKDIIPARNTGEEALILSFFFHGRGSELQRTALGLFRSLLYQLRKVPDALSDLEHTFQQRCKTVGKPGEKWQWEAAELQRSFQSSILKALQTRSVWLFVDALDECGENSAKKLGEDFRLLLQRHPPTEPTEFRICFTCRHYPVVATKGVFEICVENENSRDISTFVQGQLSSFYKHIPSSILDLITERANGVFLWAYLTVKKVWDLELEGRGLKWIETVILSVPQELDALYRELLLKMGSDSLKLIQWICFATRPLSLDELRWAMLIEPDCPYGSLNECEKAGDYPCDHEGLKRRVQTLSCGLAEVTSDAKVVQFIHQSVKDFFLLKGLSALAGAQNPAEALASSPADLEGKAHYVLSRTCVHYLAMDEIAQSTMHDGNSLQTTVFPLLHYATTSWVAHAKQSEQRGVSQDDLLRYFDWPSEALVQVWVRVYRIILPYTECPPEGTKMIHIVSRHGLLGPLQVILQSAYHIGANIKSKDDDGRTPLWWAAVEGHEAIVKLLLDKGADLDSKDRYGRTPLLWAAAEGHEAIVKLLLDKATDVESKDRYGQTPLAVVKGHEAIVKLLLDKGANIESKDGLCRRTPLWQAVVKGHEAIVKLLLDKGADLDSKDRAPTADVESKDSYSWTPLLWAAEFGHEANVKLLLDKGADVESKDRFGETPLSRAAAYEHETIVKLLLDKGANVESKDRFGETPLAWAAEDGHEAIVKLLQPNLPS